MRLRFFLAIAFLTAFAPLAAKADGISDFVLVGDGHTITFSLPTSYAAAYQSRPYNPFYVGSGVATIDGVPGDPFQATFFPSAFPQGGGDLTFTNSFSGIGAIDLGGPALVSYTPSSDPNVYLFVTFTSGKFNLSEDGSAANTPPGGTPFTLTITPESSPVPEPATWTFVATALLGIGLWSAIRGRHPSTTL